MIFLTVEWYIYIWKYSIINKRNKSVQICISPHYMILFSLPICLTVRDTVWDCRYWWSRVQCKRKAGSLFSFLFHSLSCVMHQRGLTENKFQVQTYPESAVLSKRVLSSSQMRVIFISHSGYGCLLIALSINGGFVVVSQYISLTHIHWN